MIFSSFASNMNKLHVRPVPHRDSHGLALALLLPQRVICGAAAQVIAILGKCPGKTKENRRNAVFRLPESSEMVQTIGKLRSQFFCRLPRLYDRWQWRSQARGLPATFCDLGRRRKLTQTPRRKKIPASKLSDGKIGMDRASRRLKQHQKKSLDPQPYFVFGEQLLEAQDLQSE